MEMKVEGGSSSRRLENWTNERDGVLLSFLHEQLQEDRKSGKTFSKEGWRHVLIGWKEKYKSAITLSQCKNRWKLLVEKYRLYRDLRERSGWGWDNIDNKPVAPDDETWDHIILVRNFPFL